MSFFDDIFGTTVVAVQSSTKFSEILKEAPKFFAPLDQNKYVMGEELYKWQIDHLSSSILVSDYNAPVIVESCPISFKSRLNWTEGALVSGSFVIHIVGMNVGHVGMNVGHVELKYDDIDIYFQNKEQAQAFVKANTSTGLSSYDFTNPMCAYGFFGGEKVNLIYGVEHTSPENLISRFDIRACAMAIEPFTGTLYYVQGSIQDATRKIITFNPVPRGVSVRRLEKYVTKGFKLDTHQGLFFAELIRTDIYSPQLELMTKAY